MQKWQYRVRIIHADAEKEEEYLKQTYNWDNPPEYAPQAMEHTLNTWGDQGWELIHMEPIARVGKKQDIGFVTGGRFEATQWSNAYFCVFKRARE